MAIAGDYSLKTPTSREPPRIYKWRWPLIIIALLGVLATVVGLVIYFQTYYGPPTRVTQTIIPSVPPKKPANANTTLSDGRRIFLKEDWYGEPPKFERPLRHPTPFVVISHTVTQPCYEYKDCAQQMRNMQDDHVMTHKFPDIGYSFVVGNDGNVYEGRGWDVTNMHTGFVRRCNIGISLIGNFIHDVPTVGQTNATKELIALGVKLGKLATDYKLVPMSSTYGTLSPGKNLYEMIEKWPHFWIPTKDDIGICPFDVS